MRRDYEALVGLLSGYALLSAGNGLLQTIVPLRLLYIGASGASIGVVQSCYYVGFLIGAAFNRRLIDRVGQHRAFVGLCGAAAVLALAYGTLDSLLALGLVRLATGFVFMGLYASIESWLATVSRLESRGRVFSTYAAINYLFIGAGQLLLGFGDASGAHQLIIVGALFAAAVLPVTLFEGWPVHDRTPQRALSPQPWHPILKAIHAATPLAIPGAVAVGMLYAGFYSMAPLVLSQLGLGTDGLSLFMALASIGVLVMQWPIGKLSDELDRRRVIQAVACASLGLSVLLIAYHGPAVLWPAMLIYVAITFTQYGLVVAHLNDGMPTSQRVSISTIFLVLMSLGGMLGPPLVSLMMGVLGPSGLFASNAGACAVLLWGATHALRRAAIKDR